MPQQNTSKVTLHIFLVRHYKPAISRSGWFNHKQATQFVSKYDAAGIEAILNKPKVLLFEQIKRVHCSALPRAKQTALALFGPEVELVEDKIFNECERKILALPLFRFPISVWLAGARLLWLMGLNNKEIESYNKARQRAKEAAEILAHYAEEEIRTVLVAHGMLNIFIRRSLVKMGWKVIRKGGNGYLAVTELVKNARYSAL
ncbi:histidine phosphatase family protein [Adhaeribacter aquaticus]|uniref:histidine phosphatase family protein n=1 Tax=Adhaeribacter aquaticus TaxID=299567 RepID=UPI000426A387|nr:histidine phosphatase family protein [Adhaeribacter aquaticus]